MQQAKAEGAIVYLLTSALLKEEAWPRESLDEIFYFEDKNEEQGNWDMSNLKLGVAWMMRSKKIDVIVSLDDFDVEKGAELREYFRINGMGVTTAHYFRDKLAMRMRAQGNNIAIPKFASLFHDETITNFLRHIEGPWLVKPRSEASATGIKKVHNLDEAWQHIHSLGDRRHKYLIEQFRPGDVYHADAITYNGKMLFCKVSRYLSTPMEVAHGGGVFRSVTLADDSSDALEIKRLNVEVMKAFGMKYSASHTEYIKDRVTGNFVFLETSARVGGANIADMVHAATGINVWREWARLEIAVATDKKYTLPKTQNNCAGIIISLSHFERPDDGVFKDSEITWRMHKKHHIGLIVKSKQESRVHALLNDYAARVVKDFHMAMPIQNRNDS